MGLRILSVHLVTCQPLDTIAWGINKVASFHVKVTTARVAINSSLTALDFLISSQWTKQFTSHYNLAKTYLKTAKDLTSVLVFTVTTAEILTPGFWNSSLTSFAKKANRFCKLAYSSLDTFVIIPQKRNWLNLGKWNIYNEVYARTGFLAQINILFFRNVFVIGAAGFGAWSTTEVIQMINQKIAKNKKNFEELTKESQKLLAGDLDKNTKAEEGDKLKNKTEEKFIKLCLNERQLIKSQLIRLFEIMTVALVSLQMTLAAGLELAYVANFSAVIGSAVYISSVAISVISFALIVYDIYCWKNPIKVIDLSHH
jgi:hypothetical protein